MEKVVSSSLFCYTCNTNNKLTNEMNYVINPDLYIKRKNKQDAKRNRVLFAEVLPSPFFGEVPNKKEFDIIADEITRTRVTRSFYERDRYSQYTQKCDLAIISLINDVGAIKLIHYISFNLKPNSNKIIINPHDDVVKQIAKTESYFRKCRNILEQYNIIKRTDKSNIYVVNHNMIFKGIYSDFIDIYRGNYEDGQVMFDDKGRVVLGKSIKYE